MSTPCPLCAEPSHPDRPAVLSCCTRGSFLPFPITCTESIGSLLRPGWTPRRWLRTAQGCQYFLSLLNFTRFPREECAIRDSQRSAAILNTEIHFSSSAFRSSGLQLNSAETSNPNSLSGLSSQFINKFTLQLLAENRNRQCIV